MRCEQKPLQGSHYLTATDKVTHDRHTPSARARARERSDAGPGGGTSGRDDATRDPALEPTR